MLKVTNPANGSTIAELATDTSQSVPAKYRAARAAQAAWASGVANSTASGLRIRVNSSSFHSGSTSVR